MYRKKIAAALILFPIGVLRILADSPITSTTFYEAYLDTELVREAEDSGAMSLEMAEFLTSANNPIDVKAALINALSWGADNAQSLSCYLALRQGRRVEDLEWERLSGDEVFCLGYLMVMDDYFHPQEALPYLQEARTKNRRSLTVAIIYALTQAQILALQENWPEAWRVTEAVLQNRRLKQDLRPEAIQIIRDYMLLYR